MCTNNATDIPLVIEWRIRLTGLCKIVNEVVMQSPTRISFHSTGLTTSGSSQATTSYRFTCVDWVSRTLSSVACADRDPRMPFTYTSHLPRLRPNALTAVIVEAKLCRNTFQQDFSRWQNNIVPSQINTFFHPKTFLQTLKIFDY